MSDKDKPPKDAKSMVVTVGNPSWFPPPVSRLVEYYLSLRADGLSIVTTAERALVELGYQVETAVRPRQERALARKRSNSPEPND